MNKEDKKKVLKGQRNSGYILLIVGVCFSIYGVLYGLPLGSNSIFSTTFFWVGSGLLQICFGIWRLSHTSKGQIHVKTGTSTSTQFSGPICPHCRRKIEIGTSKCPYCTGDVTYEKTYTKTGYVSVDDD